ncbi:MAG: glycosyltransferase family 4 protein, partial [Bryobacteraceae bacterium]
RYPEARLTVAHDGPQRGKLETLTRELGLQNVRFTGYVSQQQTPEVYDEADIYLTSPNIDNMPGSLLECFAAGLPVVATKAGGIPYILEDERTGLLVECNDHHAMAECAFRLMEEDGLALKLTRNARAECGKYTPDAVGRAWRELYHELRSDRTDRL